MSADFSRLKPSEFAERCAEEIGKEWCQDEYGGWDLDEGEVCAVGAIRRVARMVGSGNGIYLGMIGHLVRNQLRALVGEIPTWNDTPGRTQEEVADTFIDVAKHFRNEGR